MDPDDEKAAEETQLSTGIPKQTTMLSYAISSGDYEKVRSLLSVTGAGKVDVNGINVYGHTPLFSAVFVRDTPIAKLLLERGAEVNNGGKAEFSPLMFAAVRGNFDMVKMLLTKGADINTRNRVNGENVLHTALKVRDTNIAQFLLSLKPELATEADNEGNLPDITHLNMEGIHPDIRPLSASRRMLAATMVSRRAAEGKAIREAHAAAEDGRRQRNIEEYWRPGPGGGTRRRRRKTGKARKVRKARKALKKKTAKRRR